MGVIQPDFLFPTKRVVVEVDGRYWHSSRRQKRRDAQKNSWYYKNHYRLFRFSEAEVVKNADGCVQQVVKALQ